MEITLEDLYRSYYQRLKYFATLRIKDVAKAHDIVVDCVLGAHRKMLPTFTQEQIKLYMYTSVKNRCISALRRKERYEAWNDKYAEYNDILDTMYFDSYKVDEEHVVERIVNRLTPALKRVIELDLNGYSTSQICVLLNKDIETVYTTRRRAITSLKALAKTG